MMSKNLGKGVLLMNIKTLLFAILLSFSLTAAAEFTTVSLAHEVALSDLRIPTTPNANVGFKTCSECEFRVVRATPLTQYNINGHAVPLKELSRILSQNHYKMSIKGFDM